MVWMASAGIGAIASFTLGIIAWQEGRIEPAVLSFFLRELLLDFYSTISSSRFFWEIVVHYFWGNAGYHIGAGAVKSAATFTLAIPILIRGSYSGYFLCYH